MAQVGTRQGSPPEGPLVDQTVALLERTAALGRFAGFVYDPETDRHVWCSPELARLHGSTPAALTGASLEARLALVDPADRDRHRAALARLLATGEPTRIDYRLRPGTAGDDGFEVRHLRETAERLDGGPRVIGCVQDITEQMAKRRAARTLERRLIGATRAIPSGIAILDPERRLTYVNQQFGRLMGPRFAAALRLGETLEGIVETAEARGPLFDREMAAEIQSRLEAARLAPRSDLELRLADGRWLRVRGSALPDGGRVIVTTDISDRKAVQQQLEASGQRLRVLTESHPVPLLIVGPDDGRIFYASPPVAALLGVPHAELIGARALRFWAEPEERAGWLAKLRRQGGALNAEEVRLRRADGGTVWVALSSQLIDYEGRPAIISGVVDLTDRKRAEATDQLLRAVIDAVPAVIHLKDRHLHYRLANAYYLERWGLSAEELIGRTQKEVFADHLAFAWSRATDDRDARVLATGEATGFYQVAVPVSGQSDMILWANKAPVCNEQGEVTHVLTVGTDITELKRAEAEIARQREALHQSEKLNALGSILASIAHELNNPLAVVVGYASMLAEQAPDPATRERAERVHAAAERCTRVVRTFLAMARHRPSTPTAVDVAGVIAAAHEVLDHALESSGIEVTVDLAPDLPPVEGDADQLILVVMNLLLNAQSAVQATDPPRRIAVRARQADGSVTIEVADNGPGIAPAARERIFEPFYTTKPAGAGTGIGLSVCRNIVTAHHGEIGAASEPGAPGAVLTVRLPAGGAAPADSAPPATEGKHRGACILVVDDEPEVRQLMVEILERSGHRVETAESGREALALVLERPVDLIISDLRMPDLDGPGLHAALAAERPELCDHLVFMTGASLAADLHGFLERTGAEVLEKPFSPKELTDCVQSWLSARPPPRMVAGGSGT